MNITKQKHIHRYIQQTSSYQWGKGWGQEYPVSPMTQESFPESHNGGTVQILPHFSLRRSP